MTESIKGKKLNKGEWAEFYVMLKLLGEGKLYTADKLLQKNYKSYLDILKVIRQECASQVLEYIIDEEKSTVTIKPQDSKEVFAVIPREASEMFQSIKYEDKREVFGFKIHSFSTLDRIKKYDDSDNEKNAEKPYSIKVGETKRTINLYAIATTKFQIAV